MPPIDRDPWCCASDKLRINADGFDAGWLNAMKSAVTIVRYLSKEEAMEVLNELIAEYVPFNERYPREEIKREDV